MPTTILMSECKMSFCISLTLAELAMSARRPRHFPTSSSSEDPAEGIPTDVTFHIIGHGDTEDTYNDAEKEVLLGEVFGHKLIMAMFSPVFKRGFFGAARENKDIIEVRKQLLKPSS